VESVKPQMRKRDVGVAVLIVGVLAASLWDPIVDPFLNRERYRGEVRTLYDNLKLEMTKDRCSTRWSQASTPISTFIEKTSCGWALRRWSSAQGIGCLAIEFQSDRVSAVRVRKGDGLQKFHHPVEAPPDKVR
jgi:hypothetical protein